MKLDQYQETARLNMDKKVLLVAPPGSGKTTVLLSKIDCLIETAGVNPEAILVLTFSRAASLNLKARFNKLESSSPFFGTIHSFAYREIAKKEDSVTLIDSTSALRSLQSIRKRFVLSPEEVAAALSDISRERSTGLINEELPERFRTEVRRAYSGYKAEQGLLDFDDLEEKLLELLKDENYKNELQSRFRWILVDEFQDLNRVQLAILKLISEKAFLFCVGDEDQCIYAFRGSDTHAMIRFPEEFEGGQILYLKYNYRSSATVIRHANSLIGHNLERYPKEIMNFRTDETPVEFHLFENERASMEAAACGIRALNKGESCAIIFRTNAEMEAAARDLCRKGIRFTIQDQVYDKYGSRLYRSFIQHLRYAQAVRGDKNLFLEIMDSEKGFLPKEALLKLETSPVHVEKDLLYTNLFDLTVSQREALAVFFRDIQKLKNMKPRQAIRYVLFVMGACHELTERARRTGESLSGLLERVEDLAEEAGEFPSTSDFLRYLDNWQKIMDRRDPECPVILSTMHGVKGMEFDRVHVMNASEGLVPHERSMGEMEAERRLFYVALTRARHHLHVHGLKSWQGRPVLISRFIRESGAGPEEGGLEKTARKPLKSAFFKGFNHLKKPFKLQKN